MGGKIHYQYYRLIHNFFSLGVTMQSRYRSNMTLGKQATVTSSRFFGRLMGTIPPSSSLANTCLPSSIIMMSRDTLQRSHEMNMRRSTRRLLPRSYQLGPSTKLNRKDVICLPIKNRQKLALANYFTAKS